MLPVGKPRMGRSGTRFTRDEQQTVLSPWCMVRIGLKSAHVRDL